MSIKAYAKHDKVILKPVESTEQTSGRIVLSDNGKEKANQYQILDIGPGVYNSFTGTFTPTQYAIGDRVFVHKVHIHTLEVEGEEIFVTRENEILCGITEVVEDENLIALTNGIVEKNDYTDY